MSTLLWGQLSTTGIPQDLEKVNRNTYPVNDEAEPKELNHAPDFGEVNTDSDPELGFTGHQLGSDWHQAEKYVPTRMDTATEDHQAALNAQVATSGTAAQREARGEYGHGTINYAVGIEPTIRDGAEFGTDYFAGNRKDINEQSNLGTGVQPNIQADNADNAATMAMGKVGARDAAQASAMGNLYRAYLNGS